ncbi:hypothetical protein M427DRAFT_153389 [Gonapodya prolifera JEL478]|uniref:Uncharacterized protein n=1 Tax=Gonapodya prolifera (strain JEL478) TaxID=1344416 RepID=A0A139ANB3_GONPJ|nr:hypothetical protein M427DRAFT_153389 [Gonapodya prolifera JEL478]|eukprot:KXS18232.1 hypothetical protein M427DRAFT_153389 [Gonapodya prolifera JEL478]
MSSPGDSNSRLIDTIEDGTFDLLQVALRNGGDPNTRKRIIFKARYLLEKNLYTHEDKYVNGTDTQFGESALVLAIKSQRVDTVRALLEHGADPNRPVDWLIPDYLKSRDTAKKWDQERWNTRWAAHRAYPSALDFALFSGREKFNLKGAVVQLDNPTMERHVCSTVILFPNPDVIKVMLQLGAIPTVTAYEKAKKLAQADTPNPVFLRLIENALQPKIHRELIAANSPRGGAHAQHVNRSLNTHATLHTPDPTVAPGELQRQLSELQQLVQEQKSRIEELEMENRKLIFEVAALKRGGEPSPGAAPSVVPSSSEGDPEDAEGDVPLNVVQEQVKTRKPNSLAFGMMGQNRVPSPTPPQIPSSLIPQQPFFPGTMTQMMPGNVVPMQQMLTPYTAYQQMNLPGFMPQYAGHAPPGAMIPGSHQSLNQHVVAPAASVESASADYRQFMFRTE